MKYDAGIYSDLFYSSGQFQFYFIFRYGAFDNLRNEIKDSEGGIATFTSAYKSFGIHINQDNSVSCKEWAPGACQLYLYGDFSMLNLEKNHIPFNLCN